MAVLHTALHNNPNIAATVVGTTAGGATYLLADVSPMTAVGIGVGSALVARGILWVDSDRKTLDVPAGRLGTTPKGGHVEVDFQGILNAEELQELQEFLARTKKKAS